MITCIAESCNGNIKTMIDWFPLSETIYGLKVMTIYKVMEMPM